MNDYPLRHLSIRVPWHDAGWNGTVCNEPHLNGACARLKRIAGEKKDEDERLIAGANLNELPREQWPCCVVHERAAFMAPFEMAHEKHHALTRSNPTNYGHFRPTLQRYPAYSAGVVPFRWMMRDSAEKYGSELELDVDISREPYEEMWVHEAKNQTALLDGFAAHLRGEDSLVLFYAKHVPFVEKTNRILIGAGRIKHIGPLTEYKRDGDGQGAMVWERPVQHSIRPMEEDGFLMPYHETLRRAAESPVLDMEPHTAFAPPEHRNEFSYGSELVTHDGAISALLSMDGALERIDQDFGVATARQRQWVHDELVRLWKVRGPFPGLGAVLHAFGLSRGLFVAHALQQRAGENADPWPEVAAAFRDPSAVLPTALRRDIRELARTWSCLTDERRRFLRLLSRFELGVEQAGNLYDKDSRRSRNWNATDAEILRNPYRIFEISRHDPQVVHLLTVDRGVFPDDTVRTQHRLENPSALDSAVDSRRIRAFTVSVLEDAASAGHTLQHAGDVAATIRESAVSPKCPVTLDILSASVDDMVPEVVRVEAEGELALQLDRYREIREVVRKNVRGRIKGKRHIVNEDWNHHVAAKFPGETDAERRAQEEKAKSLAELAESRFSVLVGAAGTGKTSVLGILCAQGAIKRDGILLLAPTGKARVRMQELAGDVNSQAMTIAQFLNREGRYDSRSQRYHLAPDLPKKRGHGTVIVDEASMLTEDMLGALLDALQGVKRLILVGDPGQLPPIGAGRPFVDIVAKLRPDNYGPQIAPGYAELTIEHRQGRGSESPDRRLATWFGTTPPSCGEDDIFAVEVHEESTLGFVEWEKPEDFRSKLITVLQDELELVDSTDQRGFNRAMGATPTGDYDYFNRTRDGVGAVNEVENWQILSPVRGMAFGVGDINRQIHERFRTDFMKLASQQRHRPIPKPRGAERIVYGDKVINLSNHRRDGQRVYPQEGAVGYLANGEIGVAVGQWKTRKMKRAPSILKVEFSSQPGYTYDFSDRDFNEEGTVALELAYALTVHKAQGSEFGVVIIVVPEHHPILSRELLYTALTRHRRRVVVMHQGPRSRLKELAAPHRSETARRRTNLLADCRMLEFPQFESSVFLQEGLIHRTSKGLAVRSKSELLIAEAFGEEGVDFEYEKPLTLGGQTRYPDFTIEDEISGRTVYWEHLGMFTRRDYRTAWEKKLAWYRENGVQPVNESDNADAVLVTTKDSAESGLDMSHVKKLIAKVCGG